MSININSNFLLNTQLPIDARTVVADLTARDAIITIQRYDGLEVYLLSTNETWQLQGGITNSDWFLVSGGGGAVTSANNGLSLSANIVQLGGNDLIQSTSFNRDSNDLRITGQGGVDSLFLSDNTATLGFDDLTDYATLVLSNAGAGFEMNGTPAFNFSNQIGSIYSSIQGTLNTSYFVYNYNPFFSGSGLNDGTYGGAYTGSVNNTGIVVKIDSTGTPDTFSVRYNDSITATNVAITGAAQTVAPGITITFGATTGHTLNDTWNENIQIATDPTFALFNPLQTPDATVPAFQMDLNGNMQWQNTETGDYASINVTAGYDQDAFFVQKNQNGFVTMKLINTNPGDQAYAGFSASTDGGSSQLVVGSTVSVDLPGVTMLLNGASAPGGGGLLLSSQTGPVAFGKGTALATSEFARFDNTTGNFGLGITSPTAYLHIKAGTATSGTAPIKLTSGTNLTTPEAGAIEFNGTHFYGTVGSTRYQLDQQSGTGGTVTSIATTAPITGGTITTTGTIGITQATTSTNGYLSSTDWNTFNGKQASGNYITALTGDATATGPGSVALTLATVNSNVGSFTNASFTVNSKGLITAASSGSAPEVPLTFSTGLTRTTNTITSNLSTGIVGGQSVIGGTAASENLTLVSTSNATKGFIIFGSSGTSAYDGTKGFLGIGTTTPAALLNLSGNISAAAWGVNGINLRTDASTITDTSSSGAVSGVTAVNAIATPTLVASSATTYANAATLYIAAAPVASTNVTITAGYAFYAASGQAFINGAVIGGGFRTSTSNTNGNFAVAGTTNGTGTTNTNVAAIVFAGASTVMYRTIFNGNTSSSLGSANSYGSVIAGSAPITTFTSGTHALLANFVVNPLGTVTIAGTAVVTNTASLYINGAASGTVTGLNYGLWTTGNTRIDLGSDATGDIPYRASTGALARLAIGTSTQVLHGGTTPSYSAVSLTADVTGTLPIANGGTGATTLIGAGITNVVTTVQLTGQTADVGSTNFTGTSTAGLYRVSYSLESTTADLTAGAVSVAIAFTSAAGATTITSIPRVLTGLGVTQDTVYVQLSSGSISYSTSHTGIFGTAAYALYMTVERLN